MGFRAREDVPDMYSRIRAMLAEIHSPYNDGWTQMSYKEELYKLKCFIEDHYQDLPKFEGEAEWEKERLVKVLKKP